MTQPARRANDIQGTPAPRPRPIVSKPLGLLLVALLVALGVGQIVNYQQNKKISETQDAGIIRGYINRAVTCDLSRAIGSAEPDNCADPAIAPYRDPNLTPNSTAGARSSAKTHELVCAVLVGVESPAVKAVYDKLCKPT